jgi:hypothetical protein
LMGLKPQFSWEDYLVSPKWYRKKLTHCSTLMQISLQIQEFSHSLL